VDAAQVAIIAELRATNAVLRAQLAALQVANQALEARRVGAGAPARPGLFQFLQTAVAGRAAQAHPARTGRAGRRRPGKQPGTADVHLARVADPDEVVVHAPARCARARH
jgi:hypothetical protein